MLASVSLFRSPLRGDESDAGKASRAARLGSSAKLHSLPALGGILSFVALTIIVALAWDLNLPRVWQLNYANHARFYEVSPRSYFGWLLINPVELTLALGAPLAVMLFFSRRRPAADEVGFSFAQRAALAFGNPKNAAPVAVGLVWGLLWLTGKNSGEAARLWIPLMPLVIWAGAGAWSRAQSNVSPESLDENEQRQSSRDWLVVLAVQATVCLLTVLRVSGFMKERGLVD